MEPIADARGGLNSSAARTLLLGSEEFDIRTKS